MWSRWLEQMDAYLQVNENAFINFVSLVDPAGECWNVVPSIRFSCYIEIILRIFRVLREKRLELSQRI